MHVHATQHNVRVEVREALEFVIVRIYHPQFDVLGKTRQLRQPIVRKIQPCTVSGASAKDVAQQTSEAGGVGEEQSEYTVSKRI